MAASCKNKKQRKSAVVQVSFRTLKAQFINRKQEDLYEKERKWVYCVKDLRKQTISETEEAMGVILETLGAARWTLHTDKAGTIKQVWWSEELRRLLGYQGETELPDSMEAGYELVHPEDLQYVKTNLKRALSSEKNEEKYDIEYRLRKKSGKYHWFRAVGRCAKNFDEQQERSFYGVLVNIDERKKQEEGIRQNLRVMSILNQNYTAVYFVDLDKDRYTSYLNEGNDYESARKIVQSEGVYTTTMAKCVLQLVSEEDRERVAEFVHLENLKMRLETENEFVLRYRVADSTSAQVNFEMRFVNCSEMRGTHQVVIGFQCIDDKVQNNEIVATIGKIYWIIYRMDLLTNTYEEISSEEEMYRLTGKHGNTREVFKEVCENVVAPEYQPIMKEFLNTSTLAERMKKEESISIEYLAANGQWHLGRFIVKDRDANGQVVTVLYVANEIDERKRKELEYQRKLKETVEEAERANIAKTDFLRRMSHDIRTPINGIRGMVEIENHYANDVKKLEECRKKIWEASGYLLSLVNNVLDMNKLESGSIILEEEAFDIQQMLEESKAVIGMEATEYGVRFSMKADEIRHRYLIGSPTYLKQILMNLANNAMKYNREGGRVAVSCRETLNDGQRAVFEFICADTGIGMSEEFQERAFEPFSQEKKDARSTFTGSGLGLSIIKNLVEYMSGTIELCSKENVGTTFKIRIPIAIDRKPYQEEKTAETADIKGMRALVVEDNQLNMEIAKFMLENQGLIVTGVENGKEAVDLFAESKPDDFRFIFMDVMMPVMGGLEATRKIRSMNRPDAKSVPIFAMTANAFKDDILASLEAGMNKHLTKPLDESKIVAALQEYAH